MPLTPFQQFGIGAGGFAEGLESGMGIMDRLAARKEAQRQHQQTEQTRRMDEALKLLNAGQKAAEAGDMNLASALMSAARPMLPQLGAAPMTLSSPEERATRLAEQDATGIRARMKAAQSLFPGMDANHPAVQQFVMGTHFKPEEQKRPYTLSDGTTVMLTDKEYVAAAQRQQALQQKVDRGGRGEKDPFAKPGNLVECYDAEGKLLGYSTPNKPLPGTYRMKKLGTAGQDKGDVPKSADVKANVELMRTLGWPEADINAYIEKQLPKRGVQMPPAAPPQAGWAPWQYVKGLFSSNYPQDQGVGEIIEK